MGAIMHDAGLSSFVHSSQFRTISYLFCSPSHHDVHAEGSFPYLASFIPIAPSIPSAKLIHMSERQTNAINPCLRLLFVSPHIFESMPGNATTTVISDVRHKMPSSDDQLYLAIYAELGKHNCDRATV